MDQASGLLVQASVPRLVSGPVLLVPSRTRHRRRRRRRLGDQGREDPLVDGGDGGGGGGSRAPRAGLARPARRAIPLPPPPLPPPASPALPHPPPRARGLMVSGSPSGTAAAAADCEPRRTARGPAVQAPTAPARPADAPSSAPSPARAPRRGRRTPRRRARGRPEGDAATAAPEPADARPLPSPTSPVPASWPSATEPGLAALLSR